MKENEKGEGIWGGGGFWGKDMKQLWEEGWDGKYFQAVKSRGEMGEGSDKYDAISIIFTLIFTIIATFPS